jgi:hypothetical protein
LDWDINTGNYTTRTSWMIGTSTRSPHSPQRGKQITRSRVEVTVGRPPTIHSSAHCDLTTTEPQKKQTASHQEGHHYAGPFATMPLPHHTSPDGVKQLNSDYTTCGGLASLAAGLHTPASKKHRTRGARYVCHNTPRHRSVSRVTIATVCFLEQQKRNYQLKFPPSPF